MISFKRMDCSAVASIDILVPYYNERSFPMSFDCGNEAYAGLLVRAMVNRMEAKLKAIRDEAYEQGWKDAKSNKARSTWFSGLW